MSSPFISPSPLTIKEIDDEIIAKALRLAGSPADLEAYLGVVVSYIPSQNLRALHTEQFGYRVEGVNHEID